MTLAMSNEEMKPQVKFAALNSLKIAVSGSEKTTSMTASSIRRLDEKSSEPLLVFRATPSKVRMHPQAFCAIP